MRDLNRVCGGLPCLSRDQLHFGGCDAFCFVVLGRCPAFPEPDPVAGFDRRLQRGRRSLRAADPQREARPRSQISHPQGKQPHEIDAEEAPEQTGERRLAGPSHFTPANKTGIVLTDCFGDNTKS